MDSFEQRFQKQHSMEGCTRHPGEIIQQYCEECNELLCATCLRVHALDHSLCNYTDHLRRRKSQAENQLQRLKVIERRAVNLMSQFNDNKKWFEQGCEGSMEKLKAFYHIRAAMNEWKEKRKAELEDQKKSQIQVLENAIVLDTENVTIARPKVAIQTKARANLHKTVQGLTPNLILSESGATAFSKHSRTITRFMYARATNIHADEVLSNKSADDEAMSTSSSNYAMSVSTASSGSQGDTYACNQSRIQSEVSNIYSDDHELLAESELGYDYISIPSTPFPTLRSRPTTVTPPKTPAAQAPPRPLPRRLRSQISSSVTCDEKAESKLKVHVKNMNAAGHETNSDAVFNSTSSYHAHSPDIPSCQQPDETPPDEIEILPEENPPVTSPDDCETPPDETPPSVTTPDENPPDEVPPDKTPVAPLYETPPDETPVTPLYETPPDETPVTPPDETSPDESPPPLPPRDWYSNEDYDACVYDVYEEFIESSSSKPLASTISSEEEETYEDLDLIHCRSAPPVPATYQVQYTSSMQEVQEHQYTYIDVSTLSLSTPSNPLAPSPLPPPLPARNSRLITEDQIPEAIYVNEQPMAEEITLCPDNIIVSSCLAQKSTESVDIYDVCVSPLGIMIFSDPGNACLRILMGTNESSKKITKRFKDGFELSTVTYDQSNQRILISAKEDLYQLEFDETKPQRNTKMKVLSKGMSPLFVSSTTAVYKGEKIFFYLTTWPKNEGWIYCLEGNGQFFKKIEVKRRPFGIDYTKGNIVVATLDDGCLSKITPSGLPLWGKEVDARKSGVLKKPFGVAILPDGSIAVSECSAHRISIFSNEGKLLLRIGQQGTEPGMFDTPTGIAVRLDQELLVVDSRNKRIQIFSLETLALHIRKAMYDLPQEDTEEGTDHQCSDDDTLLV